MNILHRLLSIVTVTVEKIKIHLKKQKAYDLVQQPFKQLP